MQNLYVDTKYMMQKSIRAMMELLAKVENQLEDKQHTQEILMDSRLAPDMFSFVRQVQIMADNAKGAMGRLSGKEIPSFPDHEETLEELVNRLQKTLDFIQTVSDEDLRGADDRQMVLPYFEGKFQTAEDYVRDYAIPNFYFHFVTAYAILRMKGFDIGKADFIGGLNLKDL